jgi:hypothetical protein
VPRVSLRSEIALRKVRRQVVRAHLLYMWAYFWFTFVGNLPADLWLLVVRLRWPLGRAVVAIYRDRRTLALWIYRTTRAYGRS